MKTIYRLLLFAMVSSAFIFFGFSENNKANLILPFNETNAIKLDKKVQLKQLQKDNEKLSRHAKNNEKPEPFSVIDNMDGWSYGNFIENNEPITYGVYYSPSFNIGASYYIDSVSITLYDENLQAKSVVKLNLPDSTNGVVVWDQFSTSFFNSDNNIEFVVSFHYFKTDIGPDFQMSETWVINDKGSILHKFDEIVGGSLIDIKDESKANIRKMALHQKEWLEDTCRTYIAEASTFEIEHTFAMPWDLVDYYNGSPFSLIDIEGEKYYALFHYKLPFSDSTSPEGEPIITPNNKFIIDLFNTDYIEYKSFELDIIGKENNPFSMPIFGAFSAKEKYNISRTIYNSDNDIELVYGVSRYIIDCDCEKVDFYLVNESGTVLKKLEKGIAFTRDMAPVPQKDDQLALVIGGSDISEFVFMDLPSWQEVCSIPAKVNDELLSLDFERVKVGDDYEYLFAMGQGADLDGDVIAQICWYNKDVVKTKTASFNIGPNAAYFKAWVNMYSTSPFLFNTDTLHEFVFFTKEYPPTEGDPLKTMLYVSQENGNHLLKFEDDPELGPLYSAGFMANKSDVITSMYIIYSGLNVFDATTFYKLPLFSFAGGEGTKENPYLVSTPGDLEEVRNNLSAHYKQINDIDLTTYTYPNAEGWVPVGTGEFPFTGTYDGGGYSIKGLWNDASTSKLFLNGLFSSLSNSEIKNLRLLDVNLNGGSFVGGIAGTASGTLIQSCFVSGTIKSDGDIGGIIGQTQSFSKIKMSGFSGDIIGNASSVCGGITSDIRTSSKILFCKSSGTILGDNSIGGIVGSTMDGSVEDCYSSMDVSGTLSVGGIVGYNGASARASSILRTYSTGTVVADNSNEWGSFIGKVGGIVGSLEYNGGNVKYSFAFNDSIISSNTVSASYNRIAGFNDNDPGTMLDSNHALASMIIGNIEESDTVVSSDLKSDNGKDITISVLNQELYESMSWKFGNDTLNPWIMKASGLPILWYELIVSNISLNQTSLNIELDETFQLRASILPESASDAELMWSSSDTLIAKVSSTGLVTAMGIGYANITVKAIGSEASDVCRIKVGEPVIGLSFDKKRVSIKVDSTTSLQIVFSPNNATNKNVVFASVNPAIATVSETGVVKGIAEGSTKIIVNSEENPMLADTCDVIVVVNVGNENSSLENANDVIVYVSNGNVFVKSESEIKSLNVYSIHGVSLYEDYPLSTISHIRTDSWKSGIYVVSVKNNKGIYKTKVSLIK